MISDLNTSGSALPQIRSSASARRFTRPSLYSQWVPGAWSSRSALLRRIPGDPANAAVVIHDVRLVPEGAAPLAGLVEQVLPGDEAVVGRIEAAVVHGLADRLVQVADQAPIERQARERGQVAL